MVWLLRFIKGYLVIEFSGMFPEQVLNLIAKNGINLWNLRYRDKKITGSISIDGFRALRKIKRKTKIGIRIIKKIGLPFIVSRYKNRYGLIAGIAVFFIFLKFMSLFVWNITVYGNQNVRSDEIIRTCRQIGVYEGVKKDKFSSNYVAQKLLINMPELAWASFNVEGCKVTVNVTETVNDGIALDTPCNLKARCDGIIEKIDVTAGSTLVRTGDAVKSGDILVAGVEEKADSTVFMRSNGTIIARCEKTFVSEGEYVQDVFVPIEKSCNKTVIKAFGIKIPLYLKNIGGKYDYIEKNAKVKIFGGEVPIYTKSAVITKLEKKSVKYSENELRKKLEDDIDKKIKGEGIEVYETVNSNFIFTENSIRLERVIISHENIVQSEDILINNMN